MSEKQYYKIIDLGLIGVVVNRIPFTFQNKQWVFDQRLMDRIMGYDPYERDAIYAIGNSDIMDQVVKINEHDALAYVSEFEFPEVPL